jgi:hypothetical protein
MPADQKSSVDPQAVRSHARGKGFLIAVVGAWPIGVLSALLAVAFGAGMPVALGSGLAVALGLNFLWIGITFAIDDGDVEERARGAVNKESIENDHAEVERGPKV